MFELFGALGLLAGVGLAILSWPDRLTPEYMILMALVCLTFAGVMGIWRIVGVLRDLQRGSRIAPPPKPPPIYSEYSKPLR